MLSYGQCPFVSSGFLFECAVDLRELLVLTHSFPPRRSSALTMTLSLCFAYWFGNPSINPKRAMTIVGFASIAILGIARLTRWTYGALQEIDRKSTRPNSSH